MDYLRLLQEWQGVKAAYKARIKAARRVAHQRFKALHAKFFRAVDVLLVLAVLMNFGAVLITHALVFEKQPSTELAEANPVAASVGNLDGVPTRAGAWLILRSLVFNALVWTAFLGGFLWLRSNAVSRAGLFLLFVIVTYLFLALGRDFFGNVGYLVGKVVWGGGL